MHDELTHYGIIRRSGRYPWGSGEDNYQHSKKLLTYVKELKAQGMSEVDIAKGLALKTSELRAEKSIATNELRARDYAQAVRLKDKGYSNTEIGRIMGKNESSIRSLLDPAAKQKSDSVGTTAELLRKSVDKKGYIDVGVGVEHIVGVSRTNLKTALAQLKAEGYEVQNIQVDQMGTGNKTSVLVLAKPGETYGTINKNKDKIKMVTDTIEDGEIKYLKPVTSISSKRVFIRYDEEGGTDRDGTIELRRGVDGLDMGDNRYAQVRIGVDGTHYMKGMAIYTPDIPNGYDVVYNTNKKKGTPPEKVFKEMKKTKEGNIDDDNPFGATIKANGQRGMLNIVNEEGDWNKWSKSLSSQVLSKQSPTLAKELLAKMYDRKQKEYDEIMALTNPIVKRKLLEGFASDCDSSAVHLKAAGMERQAAHVILPIPTMKDTEIYAPKYRNGERVALIRFPHGGKFEIPELIVNNKNSFAKNVLGAAKDAVGINSKVAERLSGADFDGDTVLVIPNNSRKLKTQAPLEGLKDFDPKRAYPAYEGMPKMSPKTKGQEMGKVSNLITDMTIRGANPSELARAVRHSMVVIDAEKHHLNYKLSAEQNGIAALKKKYQGGPNAGASTLISRASATAYINKRTEGQLVTDPKTGKTKKLYIDPKTGAKLYTDTGESYNMTTLSKKGVEKTKVVVRQSKSTKMYEAKDAFSLSSGSAIETVYAEHANKLKALGNTSRKNMIAIKNPLQSKEAKAAYSAEVSSLDSKLKLAMSNKPYERQAQLIANTIVKAKREADPDMDKDSLKKVKSQALATGRARSGADKHDIVLTDREWAAIQAGAISANKLTQIMNNTNLDRLKELATPRKETTIPASKAQKARALASAGKTQAEIADALGISTSLLSQVLG